MVTLPILAMAQFIIPLVVSLAISAASYYLLRPKPKRPTNRGGIKNEATRGAFVPYVLGRRRVGTIFGWVGGRFSKQQSDGNNFWERAMHLLAIGPVDALHAITCNGKKIWKTTITRSEYPSGSSFGTGQGTFYIYWGEPDQPVDSMLKKSKNLGIASRWPYVCYIVWNKKALGTSAVWPLMEYEIETKIQNEVLTESNAHIDMLPSASDLIGSPQSIVAAKDGGPGVGYIKLSTNQTGIRPGMWVKVAGNAMGDGNFKIKLTVYDAPLDETFLYFEQTLSGTDSNGTVQLYKDTGDNGVNAAHAIYQILFDKFPHGLELDTDEFDLQSFEDVGELIEQEHVPINMICEEGNDAVYLLGQIMQDMGLFFSLDTETGKYKLLAIREPSGTKTIPLDMVMPPLPENEINHDVRKTDRVVCSYPERQNNYRDWTINLDDDGQADAERHVRPRVIDLATVTDLEVANVVGERRSQEELAGVTKYRFYLNREGRFLLPGQTIAVPGFPQILLVLEVKLDPDSSKVEITAVSNFYGVPASTHTAGLPGGSYQEEADNLPLKTAIIEVPRYLSPGKTKVWLPSIRAHGNVRQHNLHIAQSNTETPTSLTFTKLAEDAEFTTGGELLQAIAAGGSSHIEVGPTFEALGPDIADVLDLTNDEANWRSGKQLCLINDEVFFLRNIEAVGGDVYRLRGLIRARYARSKDAHSIGDAVFIFPQSASSYSDDLITQGTYLWVKFQPVTDVETPLYEIAAIKHLLRGDGERGLPVANLRTDDYRSTYKTTENINLSWRFRQTAEPTNGAGLYAAGVNKALPAAQGSFTLLIQKWDTDHWTTVRTVPNINMPTHTYLNSELKSDHGGTEPASFRVAVCNVVDGVESDHRYLIVEKD